MKICIGGDLNGQVVEKDVYSFKAADIDPEKSQSISPRVLYWVIKLIDSGLVTILIFMKPAKSLKR